LTQQGLHLQLLSTQSQYNRLLTMVMHKRAGMPSRPQLNILATLMCQPAFASPNQRTTSTITT
jgi:hypothetical protein